MVAPTGFPFGNHKRKPAPSHHGCAPKHDDPCKRNLKKDHCHPKPHPKKKHPC